MVRPAPEPPSYANPVRSEFPVEAAEDLDVALIYLAANLEEAKQARVRAERNLTEFKGGVADQYRDDLRRHVGHLNDTIEQIHRVVGRLRDAIREHESTPIHPESRGTLWR
jgi:hypothetical protein